MILTWKLLGGGIFKYMFKNPKIFLEKQQIRALWHKEYGRKWLLKLQHQSQNTEAILSKNQIKSSA